MAEGVKVEIVSPETLVLSAQAQSVTIPAAEGYLTVLGPHAPLLAVLRPGFVTVVENGGTTARFFVAGGFVDINESGLTILAEEARPEASFGRAELEARIAQAQQDLSAASEIDDKLIAQERLDTWKNLLLESTSTSGTAH